MRAAARRTLITYDAYDAILTPTLAQPPAPVGGIRDDADPAADFERQKAFSPFSAVWNITGQPAVSLPLYWSAAGLPIGVTLAGRPGSEAMLLTLAAQLESASPWQAHRSPVW
jgi:amidase